MKNPNKKVISIEFTADVSILRVDEEGIEFSDGTIISDYHIQDCCERVYANWIDWKDDFKNVTDILAIRIWTVENAGLRIEFDQGHGANDFVWFVACYNQQNGYYNSDLELSVITGKKAAVVTDISKATHFSEC